MNAVYRAVLRCYPLWWREQRGEEALGVLQDSAEARGHADPRDVLNLAAHGVRLRLGRAGAPTTDRSLRNRISVIALALLAAVCSTLLIFGEWAPWDHSTSFGHTPIANLTTGSICYLAGLLAAVAAAFGRATAARRLAVFSGVTALLIMWAPIDQFVQSHGFTRPPGVILAFSAALCALVAVGEPVPPRGSRSLFVLLAAVPTAGAVLVTALSLGPDTWYYYRLPDQIAVRTSGGILVGIGLMVIAIVLLVGGYRSWARAIAVNSVPWLLLFSSDPLLSGFAVLPMGGLGLLVAVIGLALLAGIGVVTVGRRLQPARNSAVRIE